MKLSHKSGDATSLPAPESTAQLVAILDTWEPSCPDAGRAAQVLRRKSSGRPVVYRDQGRAIEAYELELRTGMSRTSACMHVTNSIASKKILDEIVLSISRRKRV